MSHLLCRFGCLSYIMSVLFPFRYPIKLDIDIFGGIDTLICIWFTHTAPDIIFTPLYLHNIVIISLTSFLNCPYSTFFLYFGIKRYDTGTCISCVINSSCPFGLPPVLIRLACNTVLMLAQEALFCYP